MSKLRPKPVVVTGSIAAAEPDGTVHRIAAYQGWYADIRANLTLRQTASAADDVVVTLRERRLDLALHSRTVTLVQNAYVNLDMSAILNRIETAADLRIELRTTGGADYTGATVFDYTMTIQRHEQQGA